MRLPSVPSGREQFARRARGGDWFLPALQVVMRVLALVVHVTNVPLKGKVRNSNIVVLLMFDVKAYGLKNAQLGMIYSK